MKKASEYDLNLPPKIKIIRKKNGVSSLEIASCLNMSISNYYKIERGEVKITYGQFMVIVQKSKISRDEFVNLFDFEND